VTAFPADPQMHPVPASWVRQSSQPPGRGRSGSPGLAGRATRAAVTSSRCRRAPRWSLLLPGHAIARCDQVVTVDQPLHSRACRGTNQRPACRSSRHLLRASGRG